MNFDELVRSALNASPISGADDLKAFAEDMRSAFSERTECATIDIVHSEESLAALDVHISVSPAVQTIQDISRLLRECWVDLHYDDFQATVTYLKREAVVMRFVTSSRDGALCVTGRIIATAPHYEALRAAFERDFYALS